MSTLPLDEPPSVKLDRFIKAINREISYRERVYPRLVGNGKMSEVMAAQQIDVMVELRCYLEQRRREVT